MPTPLHLVNPLCGSDSEPDFSTGLTYPAVGVPWGMTYFSPRNRPGGRVFSRRRSWPVNRIDGFTATHAPSPWMGDYGSFTLTPGVGRVADDPRARQCSYRLDSEESRPDLYRVRLSAGDVECELTATCRCGVLRLHYPKGVEATLTLQLHSPRGEGRLDDDGVVRGVARDGHGLVDGFGCHFVVRADRPFARGRPIGGDDGTPSLALHFEAGDGPVTVRVGTSFISHAQAELNLQREVGDRPFEQVRDAAGALWNAELDRVQIDGGTDAQRRTFYTGLWRALLFPRVFHEVDADGKTIHFSPYTGRVEVGELVTDNGFWDTSRTVYPLLSLAWRDKLGQILNAWLPAFEQSGWMPQWASPGHRACMVGTHSAAVFADAITKGVGGFDHRVALESMLKDADVPGDPEGRFGRQQLPEYLELGFCPEVGALDSVCRTIDYGYNDWCCARVLETLGRGEEAADYDRRAAGWKKLFDPRTKFLRPLDDQGRFAGAFEEFRWGGPYREGGPWQYRFSVPHDATGLADLLGGADALATGVEQMVATPPRFFPGTYGSEIHEMSEMAGATMGQYAHSNQPVHGVLWQPARVGRPDVTDRLVRRVLDELYTPETFPGDEDNGEMGAWYVLAALGLFPHCPGDPAYTSTVPLFESATLHGDDGRTIRLTRGNAASQDRRVTHQTLLHAADTGEPVSLP